MTRFLLTMIAVAGLAGAQEKGLPQLVRQNRDANIELTVYLVSGYAQAQPAGKDEVPPDLSATLQQLRGVFAYKSYRLIEAITLRGRNGSSAEVAGDLADYSHYNFRYRRAMFGAETPHLIRLDGLHLEITRRTHQASEVAALVATDIDIKEGQRTVVGKSAVNGTDALFLVIVPKVIE